MAQGGAGGTSAAAEDRRQNPSAVGSDQERRRVLIPVAVFVLTSVLIFGIVGLQLGKEKERQKAEAQASLATVADLRARHVSTLRGERMGDAAALVGDRVYVAEVLAWLQRGAPDGEVAGRIRSRLASVKEAYNYRSILVVDRAGQARLIVGDSPRPEPPGADDAKYLAAKRRPYMVGPYVEENVTPPRAIFDIVAPIGLQEGQAAASIVLRGDFAEQIGRHTESLAANGHGAETLLVQRDGDHVLVLTGLRFRTGSAMLFRLPLSLDNLPAAMAIRGSKGPYEGIDYRGVPVLAAVQAVPDSPWYVIAKSDLDDVYAPLEQRAIAVAGFSGTLLALAGLAMLLWWLQQRNRFLQAQADLSQELDSILRAIPDLLFEMDENGRYLKIWTRQPELLAAQKAQLLGHTARRVLPAAAAAAVMDALNEAARTGQSYGREIQLPFPQDAHWFELSVAPMRGVAGAPRRFVMLSRDVTKRKQAEEKLKTSLDEKDVLLKEIYHRVKNNLQVVASLLNMQGNSTPDPELRGLLQESANRIKAMGLVHQQLYRSNSLGRIAFADYLRQLGQQIAQTYHSASCRVRLFTESAPVELAVETAIPCGLIVNELVSNAYKHAFAADAQGEIRVGLAQLADGQIRFTVSDDGCGLPAGFRPEQTPSLGMRLVLTLVQQVGGTLRCESGAGTRFEFVFRPGEGESSQRPD